jgi:hypothetical protein
MYGMKITALILSIFLPVLYSCSTVNPEEEAIRRLIGKYNMAIVTAYKNLGMEPLREVASKERFEKVEVIINSFMQGGQMMEAELLELDFKGMEIDAERARVRTSEDWKYRWVDVRTREVKVPLTEIHYEMLYHLIKRDDRWLVEKTEEVEEPEEELS